MNTPHTDAQQPKQRTQQGHLHIISMHTSPLAQPGQGDAGGMNVYIARSLEALTQAAPDLTVEVFTLDTHGNQPASIEISPQVTLHNIVLPQALGATKDELYTHIEDFAQAVDSRALIPASVVHSHYWLSGLVALKYAASTPLVHTMHTTAAAKNAAQGEGEQAESSLRYSGEQLIVNSAAVLVVNTELEAQQMITYYGARAEHIKVIAPGVQRSIFYPRADQPPQNLGSSTKASIVFAGRPQHLKGPHILIEAISLLPSDLEVSLTLIGKSGGNYEQGLLLRAQELGVNLTLRSPLHPQDLATAFRQADLVACPSSSETFGLVALEAQSCGTPVLASDVDGLRTAVQHGVTGILVKERTPAQWAQEIEYLVRSPGVRYELGQKGAVRAAHMTWSHTARQLLTIYRNLSHSI